ncbi:ribonuclease P protein subunit rpr2-like [Diaphorina citri]|jgi:RNase P subunit RPR2|uniref:Ribonuclease P protein subunit rpr2-like n=1 Tax=Diaphorina citri TaxID=121845 RepID=A0A3Q0IP84_DIACI|nr:ribonuclease P protein subunit rpr2-like [Diaphorina citri]
MEKNSKGKCVPPKQLNKSFQNHDNIHRINYLFELSKLTNKKYPQLSRYYSKSLKLISRKTQQRLDASIKHNLCKACNANLHSNPNVKIKMKKKHILQTCPNCLNVKNFPCDTKQDKQRSLLDDDRVHEIYVGYTSMSELSSVPPQSECQSENVKIQEEPKKEIFPEKMEIT